MIKIGIFFCLTIICFIAHSQTWTLNKTNSKMSFLATHLLVNEVEGVFKSFDSKMTFSKEDFSDAVFELTADMNQVFTDNSIRDGRLKRPDAFDTGQFPVLTFKSTKITALGNRKYKLYGNLNLKGISKMVAVNVSIINFSKSSISLTATGTLNRNDFNVGDFPTGTVSDEINLKAYAEYTKK